MENEREEVLSETCIMNNINILFDSIFAKLSDTDIYINHRLNTISNSKLYAWEIPELTEMLSNRLNSMGYDLNNLIPNVICYYISLIKCGTCGEINKIYFYIGIEGQIYIETCFCRNCQNDFPGWKNLFPELITNSSNEIEVIHRDINRLRNALKRNMFYPQLPKEIYQKLEINYCCENCINYISYRGDIDKCTRKDLCVIWNMSKFRNRNDIIEELSLSAMNPSDRTFLDYKNCYIKNDKIGYLTNNDDVIPDLDKYMSQNLEELLYSTEVIRFDKDPGCTVEEKHIAEKYCGELIAKKEAITNRINVIRSQLITSLDKLNKDFGDIMKLSTYISNNYA